MRTLCQRLFYVEKRSNKFVFLNCFSFFLWRSRLEWHAINLKKRKKTLHLSDILQNSFHDDEYFIRLSVVYRHSFWRQYEKEKKTNSSSFPMSEYRRFSQSLFFLPFQSSRDLSVKSTTIAQSNLSNLCVFCFSFEYSS